MSDIDRDALIAWAAGNAHVRLGHEGQALSRCWPCLNHAEYAVDAILPTVTQAIRAAEQRGQASILRQWNESLDRPSDEWKARAGGIVRGEVSP